MPRIFLSPSTQEYNPYITGNGSEEYFMNQIADAMEPYLLANTIRFTRNTPDMTAASSIRLANSGKLRFLFGASLQRQHRWYQGGRRPRCHRFLLSHQC